MGATPLACTRCGTRLPEDPAALASVRECAGCGAGLLVRAFPACTRPRAEGGQAQPVILDGEAGCFSHAGKRAVAACDQCGRFLCALCDFDLNGRHLCPTCLESGGRQGRIAELERARTRYDQIVWALLFLPILFFFVVPITATLALGLAVWKWRSPPSRVHRTRLRLALAIPVAVLELAGSLVFWAALFAS